MAPLGHILVLCVGVISVAYAGESRETAPQCSPQFREGARRTKLELVRAQENGVRSRLRGGPGLDKGGEGGLEGSFL